MLADLFPGESSFSRLAVATLSLRSHEGRQGGERKTEAETNWNKVAIRIGDDGSWNIRIHRSGGKGVQGPGPAR